MPLRKAAVVVFYSKFSEPAIRVGKSQFSKKNFTFETSTYSEAFVALTFDFLIILPRYLWSLPSSVANLIGTLTITHWSPRLSQPHSGRVMTVSRSCPASTAPPTSFNVDGVHLTQGEGER